jgi:hypothetical protein
MQYTKMDIKINDKTFPKKELLQYINTSKISAIISIQNFTQISLKDAKEIVENFSENSDYYDNIHIKKPTREFVENESFVIDVDTKNSDSSEVFVETEKSRSNKDTNKKKQLGSHFIENKRTVMPLFFGFVCIAIILLYFLLRD